MQEGKEVGVDPPDAAGMMIEDATAADNAHHRHQIHTAASGKTDQEITLDEGHKPTEEDLDAIARSHLRRRSVKRRKWLPPLSLKAKCYPQHRVVSTCLRIKCERSSSN
jgi:hypothetical protein